VTDDGTIPNWKARLAGLIFACPYDQGAGNTECEFRQIRRLNTAERMVFLGSISRDEALTLISKHDRCLGCKENQTSQP
jgi:hypothetical protein